MTDYLDKRSADYRFFGRLKAALAAVFFLTVIGYAYVTIHSWETVTFKGTQPLDEATIEHIVDGQIFKSEVGKIPHKRLTDPPVDKSSYRLRYMIPVGRLQSGERGLAYLHLGWVGGESVSINYNGTGTMHSGFEKVVFPYTGDGTIFIEADCKTGWASCGLIGRQPAAIATGMKQNNKIFGLETLMTDLNSMSLLFPSICMGLILACAWLLGFKGRVLFISTSVLLLIVCQSALVAIGPKFLPALEWRGYYVLSSLLLSTWVFCFHLEVTKLWRKKIYLLQRTFGISALVAGVVFSGEQLHMTVMAPPLKIASYFVFCFGSVLIAAFYMKSKHRSSTVMISLVLTFGLFAWDLGAWLNGKSPSLHMTFEIFLPIYVAYLALVDIASSEKRYQAERAEKARISEAFELETEKTASLQRFLPQTIVDQFRGESMQENIENVLKPRLANVAVIQADMRGFSNMMSTKGPEAVSQVIKECFGPVVLKAQEFSYLKLVGDCFFAFIEVSDAEKSSTDRALDIAAQLIQRIEIVNKIHNQDSAKFGIGIAYGEALVGNLSSDQCIDYSVLGDVVNLTARLEELTKQLEIQKVIGDNGIILSTEAFRSLRYYSYLPSNVLKQVQVRSFPDVTFVNYLKAADLQEKSDLSSHRKLVA